MRGTSTGAGQTVAVVDTGVDEATRTSADTYPAATTSSTTDVDPTDPDGHGTHVAGTIAATRDNGEGIAGVAPEAASSPLRVLDENGDGRRSDIIEAFDCAGDHGVRIVNASLGADPSRRNPSAMRSLHTRRRSYVVAAGNGTWTTTIRRRQRRRVT